MPKVPIRSINVTVNAAYLTAQRAVALRYVNDPYDYQLEIEAVSRLLMSVNLYPVIKAREQVLVENSRAKNVPDSLTSEKKSTAWAEVKRLEWKIAEANLRYKQAQKQKRNTDSGAKQPQGEQRSSIQSEGKAEH